MNLTTEIMRRVEELGAETVLRRMGYGTITKPLQRLQAFGAAALAEWLRSGGFDFRYTNEQFVRELIKATDLQGSACKAMDTAVAKNTRLVAMDQPSIFVETGFRRTTQSIQTLACMARCRRIAIDKQDVLEDPQDELARICALVRKHYEVNQGELPMWGKIQSYVYHPDFRTKIIIDPEGVVQPKDTPVCESCATLRVG
ncbi:MAG: hypothetical protein BWK76_18170 [Desulfobulbaceae bacterium A2]|nr:MAG: hypothetical protein BWK76_18170 [Desulfobulbaceae bacterium A2]